MNSAFRNADLKAAFRSQADGVAVGNMHLGAAHVSMFGLLLLTSLLLMRP
ncbi:MAG: hypothetical protein AAGE61_22070 [Pseudomonadota bacterium]